MLKWVVERAIPTFEKVYPGHIRAFVFDNPSGHAYKADDALGASRMNLGTGGKQLKMHSTILPDGMEQGMIFKQTDISGGVAF